MKKLFILLLYSTVLLGQRDLAKLMPAIGVLEGVVVDSTTKKPIEYASISVSRVRDGEIVTGAVTDNRGKFKIQEIPLDRYRVAVEYIGYKKAVIESVNLLPGKESVVEQNLGTITLFQSAIELEEVDVIGEVPQYIQTIDKKIFFVDQNLTVQGGTAADALKKIPSVDVDIDGNISLRGDQNVNVLIDGRPSGLTHGDRRAMVENIPVAMIERVEVITNPSAKYDPDGMGGIINIILKRGHFEGINGNTVITAGQFDQLNASGLLNFRREKFNIFTNGSYRAGNRRSNGQRTFIMDYDSTADTSKHNTSRIKMPVSTSLKLGGDYFVADNQTISLSTTLSDHNDTSEEIVTHIFPEQDKIESNESDYGSTREVNLSYVNDFENPEQKLELDISYSFSDDRQEETSYQGTDHDDHAEESGRHTHADEWQTNLVVRGDYTHPLNVGTILETGLKSTMKYFDSDLEYLIVPYDFRYSEDIHAVYGTLAHDFNAVWGIKLGLRAEQAQTTAEMGAGGIQDTMDIFTTIIDKAITQGPYSNSYFKVYPSIFWMYNISEDDQLQFGYSKRVNRPRRWSMNPFPRDFFDTIRIRTGNPYIKPEFSDVIEINFSHFDRKLTLNAGVYYKRVVDMMRWWDSDFVHVGDIVYEVTSPDNAGKAESSGIEFMVNYRPLSLISAMVSLTTWNARTFGSGEADLNGTSQGYFLFGMSTISIPRIARLELSCRYRGPIRFVDGDIRRNFTMDLALQKGFLQNRLSLTIKVSDVFNSSKFRINTKEAVELGSLNYIQIMDAERRRAPRTVYLTFSYNFGNLEQKKRWSRRDRQGEHGGDDMMDMDY